ncbi:MAG: TolC family protein [Desulfotalea sp.]
MKKLLSSCLLIVALFFWQLSQSAHASNNDYLDQLVQEAMNNNQELASLEDKARALRAEAPYAGSLPDPRITLAINNLPTNSFDFGQEAMTQKQVGFAQQIPWFGTLGLREQRAELLSHEQEALTEAKRLNITKQLKKAWYKLVFIQHSIRVNSELIELVQQVLRIAENRYSMGQGLQQDILLTQVQLSELLEQRISYESQTRQLQDTIGGLLNRETLFVEHAVPSKFPSKINLDHTLLTQIGLMKNPLLQAKKTKILVAEVDVQLAEHDYMPDMDFRVSYGQRDDDPVTGRDREDFFSAGITLTVPLWQKTRQDSKLDANKRRLLSAQKSHRSLELTLPHQIDSALASINGSYRNHSLLSKATSLQTAQFADASLAAYSVGKIEFSAMLDARMRLAKIALQIEEQKYRIYQKIAELEEITGQAIHFEEVIK